jgi:GNAT superfamily N-acetyltransferase
MQELVVHGAGSAGAVVAYRPIDSHDRSAFLDLFDGLSAHSRYMRYHGVKPVLSQRELRYFVDVDHHDHEAIVAVAGTEAVGVARFVRRTDDQGSADVAVEVVDRWQRRGIGSRLLGLVAARARDEGIERLQASVLQANVAMLATIQSLRAPCRTTSRDGPVLELEVELDHSKVGRPLKAG